MRSMRPVRRWLAPTCLVLLGILLIVGGLGDILRPAQNQVDPRSEQIFGAGAIVLATACLFKSVRMVRTLTSARKAPPR